MIIRCDTCSWYAESPSRVLREIALDKHMRDVHSPKTAPVLETTIRFDPTLRQSIAAAHDAIERRRANALSQHVHGLACTYEVCGVGPTRASLVAASVARWRTPQ